MWGTCGDRSVRRLNHLDLGRSPRRFKTAWFHTSSASSCLPKRRLLLESLQECTDAPAWDCCCGESNALSSCSPCRVCSSTFIKAQCLLPKPQQQLATSQTVPRPLECRSDSQELAFLAVQAAFVPASHQAPKHLKAVMWHYNVSSYTKAEI